MTTATITATEIFSKIPAGWELKGFKEMKSMSEETRCYTATIYFQGRKIATASNHGHGGPDMYHFASKEDEAMALAVGKEYDDSKYGGFDTMVADLVEETEMRKVAKRDAKAGRPITVFIKCGRTEAPRHETLGGGTFIYFQSQYTLSMSHLDQLPALLAKNEADEYMFISK